MIIIIIIIIFGGRGALKSYQSVLNKCKSAILLYLMAHWCLFSAFNKAKLLPRTFSMDYNLDDLGFCTCFLL